MPQILKHLFNHYILILACKLCHSDQNNSEAPNLTIFGMATAVQDTDQKFLALEAFSEHIVPGRWAEVCQPTPQELMVTSVLELPLSEASDKVRTGSPDFAIAILSDL
jgi:nitroimidazol reductase NimA-like FMN-containing flavoprotein (pyridoxamine 5'-phosphate oxidase superfamily)